MIGIIVGFILLVCFIAVQVQQKNKQVLVDARLITFVSCKPFANEINNDGYAVAMPYKDKKDKTRYCCNPNHTHYFA